MRLKNILIFTLLLFIPLFSQDWPTLQNTLIKFYRYQRSGLKPTTDNTTGNPYNPFYTHVGSGNDAGKYPHWGDGGTTPLDGGWYDAGDFMKFGLPLGFSVYCLLKGYDAFPDAACYDDLNSWSAIGTKDNIPDILNEAKVGTDYLIKAVISSSQIAQTIGTGSVDHGALAGDDGYTNSTRTYSNRPVRFCDGADVPGFYAAALALMSILYKPYDAAYSATCLQKAQAAYTFAIGHLKPCTEQTDQATGAPFYSAPTYQDKLACAAIELYRATKDATYLTAAKTYLATVPQHYDVLGFAHCGDLAAFELFRQGDNSSQSIWRADISLEITRVVKAGTAYVGGATVNTTDWGVCRTVGNSAFSAALLYSISGDIGLKLFALQQIKWLAGLSPYTKSWITQYGSGFPQNPHSRNDYNLKSVARLTGGVVSGPSSANCTGTDKSTCSWTFSDDANNYKNTECALDYGCGAIGAVAFIRWTAKTDSVRLDSGLVATPANLDMASQSETINGLLSQAASWTLVLKGATSNAVKTYTGTTAKILVQNWSGDKDAGSPDFTVEKVNVYLDSTKMKIWNVQRATVASTYFNIVNIPGKAWGAKDVEVDNFEDTARLTNLLGGKWSAYCDASDSVSGGKSSTPIISSDSGRGSAKGLYFSLTRSAGATAGSGPYAGIRTTFNAQGSSVDLGLADTIMFDIKPLAAGDSIWVQLEQSDITDRAYFGAKLTFGPAGAWVRVYMPIASFTQPSWKTTVKAINLKKAVAVRFVTYGAGSSRYVIDNLRISNLTITQNAIFDRGVRATLHAGNSVAFYRISAASITYGLFLEGAEGKTINADLFDCLGKRLLSYHIVNYIAGKAIILDGCNLRTGIYFLKHTVAETHKSIIAPVAITK